MINGKCQSCNEAKEIDEILNLCDECYERIFRDDIIDFRKITL